MSYCTLDDARSAGATGTDAEVTQAIADAQTRVERYTGELFEPNTLTIECDVDSDGLAWVRKRIRTVTSVTWAGAPAPLEPSAYRVSSSLNIGGRDVIALYGDLSWADVTVLGAEPWNGGWANLARAQRVLVLGSFGYDTPPRDVVMATALIAAKIRQDDVLTDSGSSGGKTSDAEGNVLPVVPPFRSENTTQAAVERLATEQGRVRSRTTGVLAADSLLAPYVREPVRMRA